MNHPDDQTLERYRIRKLTAKKAAMVQKHMVHCLECSSKLRSMESLDQRLTTCSLEEPSADFTLHVMANLSSPARKSDTGKHYLAAERRSFGFRPEMTNALVAIAATYLFVSSGFISAVISVDSGVLENQLYTGIETITEWVARISSALY